MMEDVLSLREELLTFLSDARARGCVAVRVVCGDAKIEATFLPPAYDEAQAEEEPEGLQAFTVPENPGRWS